MRYPKHNILKTKNKELFWQFDTFRTPEGNDRALKNGLRLVGIASVVLLFHTTFFMLVWIPLYALAMLLTGLTDIKYFRNKRKKLEWESWT